MLEPENKISLTVNWKEKRHTGLEDLPFICKRITISSCFLKDYGADVRIVKMKELDWRC